MVPSIFSNIYFNCTNFDINSYYHSPSIIYFRNKKIIRFSNINLVFSQVRQTNVTVQFTTTKRKITYKNDQPLYLIAVINETFLTL